MVGNVLVNGEMITVTSSISRIYCLSLLKMLIEIRLCMCIQNNKVFKYQHMYRFS